MLSGSERLIGSIGKEVLNPEKKVGGKIESCGYLYVNFSSTVEGFQYKFLPVEKKN